MVYAFNACVNPMHIFLWPIKVIFSTQESSLTLELMSFQTTQSR